MLATQLFQRMAAKSLLYAMRGRVAGWGKLEWRATVPGGVR